MTDDRDELLALLREARAVIETLTLCADMSPLTKRWADETLDAIWDALAKASAP